MPALPAVEPARGDVGGAPIPAGDPSGPCVLIEPAVDAGAPPVPAFCVDAPPALLGIRTLLAPDTPPTGWMLAPAVGAAEPLVPVAFAELGDAGALFESGGDVASLPAPLHANSVMVHAATASLARCGEQQSKK